MLGFNKIFQIGFNKCGTYSLFKLFNNFANPSISAMHWNKGYLAKNIYENINTGKFLPLFGYDGIQAYFDMECFIQDCDSNITYIPIYKDYFDLLDINYPNSLFILNTRNKDKWIKSRLNHWCLFSPFINDYVYKANYRYVELFKNIYNTNNEKDITDIWSKEWDDHHENIYEYFSRRNNSIIIYNIEKDNLEKLILFFMKNNLKFTTTEMPHENRTPNY